VERAADEDCLVLIGRIVRTNRALADMAREPLESARHPSTQVFARRVRARAASEALKREAFKFSAWATP
jgi:hypothetical protein